MDLRRDSSSLDTTTVNSTERSSPHRIVMIQSFLNLPESLELNLAGRYVGALPAQAIGSYGTADAEVGWHPAAAVSFSIVGQNLVQPHHPEFGGDPGTLVGIQRSVYAKITWRSAEK
jgi:iron complex outermembrane receptor protein